MIIKIFLPESAHKRFLKVLQLIPQAHNSTPFNQDQLDKILIAENATRVEEWSIEGVVMRYVFKKNYCPDTSFEMILSRMTRSGFEKFARDCLEIGLNIENDVICLESCIRITSQHSLKTLEEVFYESAAAD